MKGPTKILMLLFNEDLQSKSRFLSEVANISHKCCRGAKDRGQIRGRSRTSSRRGRQSLGGDLPNILVIFSEKPYEIKEILVRKGGCAPQIRHCK